MLRYPEKLPPLLAKYFPAADAPPLETWPLPRVIEYQRDAVAEQLAHVFANNEFYRAKFAAAGVKPEDFKSLDDLSRFPFTVKDELRGQPWMLLSVPKDEVILAHTSTGTFGGVWSYNLYSWEDLYVRDLAVFPGELMELSASDVVINALPYEMSSAGQSFQRSIQGAVGAMVVPVGKGGFYSDVTKTVRVMAELGATVLITTPPYAMVLAEVAAKLGLVPGKDISLARIWLTGEGCSPAYRKRLEALWQCDTRVFYGSLECGPIAIEGRSKAGLHISAGHVYLEIVDPKTGAPVPAGTPGEVVCTILQRRASPLVRFRTQDLAVIEPAEATTQCEFQLPRLQIRGRLAEQVQQGEAAGPAISPYMIEEVLYSHAAMGGNYQIFVDGRAVAIHAEYAGVDAAREATREQIQQTLAQRGVQAEMIWVEHLPRTGGKARRVRPLSEHEEVMKEPCILKKSC